MSKNQKQVSDLTAAELEQALHSLAMFYDFTFFGERNIDESMGLTFGLEMLVCTLNLVLDDGEYEQDGNTATLMENFVNALQKKAIEINFTQWNQFVSNLPYGRGLTSL